MKRNTLSTAILIILTLAGGGFWLVSSSRAATETPEYKVVRTDGKFEIRDYPALAVANTPMDGADMNGSFMRLFRFITGTNDEAKKIEMTAPVLIDSTEGKRTMSFIMPKDAAETGIPKPTGDKVALGKIDSAQFAVFRFSGGRNAENEKNAAKALAAWLEGEKITATGTPIFAYYDPPWTPVFMRRNEVMLRIEKNAE